MCPALLTPQGKTYLSDEWIGGGLGGGGRESGRRGGSIVVVL